MAKLEFQADMFNIFKRLKTRKISQLKLKGFKVDVKEKNKNLKILTQFITFIFKYFLKKVQRLVYFFGHLIKGSKTLVENLKNYTVKKLIWSRGKLGRPIANLIIMAMAFVVFTFGEILNSSRFVNSQEINPDYLSNTTDILPNKNTALTTIPEDRKRAESFEYTVQSGDTLSSIGQKFKIALDALEYVNGLTDNSVLSVGDVLTIPPISGLIHEVEDGDSLSSIAEKYSVAPQAIADFNYILDTSSLAVGSELVIPGAEVPEVVPIPTYIPSYVPQPSYLAAPNLGDGFVWPTSVYIITQYFYWYHNGIDIAVPWGRGMPPIYATSSGTVVRSGWDPWGLGLHVAIDHGNGYSSVYGHLSRIDVGYGQQVSKGQRIGLMGNTGYSTGPHLHFTIKYNGVAQNPLNFIQ